MWQCPVCTTNNDNNHSLCTKCGFDERTDFVKYRTLCSVSAIDCEKRKKQKKAQKVSESKLKEIQKAFKEAFDKSILNPQTVSVDIVREELLKQGYEMGDFKNKRRIWERSYYCFQASGRLPRNYSTSYHVSYLEHYPGKDKPCSGKHFLFMGMPKDNASLAEKDAIDRMTPLPFGIRMGDRRETVQKKLGLTENMVLAESGNVIVSNAIDIRFEKEEYRLAFNTRTKQLHSYTADFSN
jgi:hypothetical protein